MSTKKLLCILASVVLAVTLLTFGVFAADTAVAKIGDTTYDTLAEAIAAATEGDTVTLLQDTSGGGIVIGKIDGQKNFTIDFNGHTYTVNSSPLAGSTGTETQCFQLLKATESLTMKNGTIVADYSGVKMMIQNYCSLTLEDMTLDATAGTNNIVYVLSDNNGNTTITGSTTITAKSNGVAFDVFYWPEYGYTSVSVTVDSSDVTINGTVEYSAYTTVDPENTVLIINAGTVNGTIVASNLNEDEEATILVATTATVSGGVTGSAALVAEAGGVQYTSVQAAIDAVGSGTVTLLQDTEEDIVIASSQTITLNLNGHTLTNVSGDTITVELGATLTIEGSGTVDNVTHQKAAIANNGTVTLNGGTYTRSLENGQSSTDNGGNSFYTIINHGTMTINDGVTVTQDGHYSSMIENGYQDYNGGNARSGYVAGTNSANPTLTINGGTFTGGLNTVKNDDGGTLVINGGSFSNTTQATILNWNEATINDGTFVSTAYVVLNGYGDDTLDKGELTINGGTFTAGSGYSVISEFNSSYGYGTITIYSGTFTTGNTDIFNITSGNTGTITIYGGTYSVDVPDEYIANGLNAVQLSSGYWVIGGTEAQITVSDYSNGKVTTDPTGTAVSGQTVTITAIPESSYYKAVVTVYDATGAEVTVTTGSNNTYTFTMPNSAVTVSVSFVRVKDEISGIFYVNESYHGIMVNGHLLSIPHTVNEAGYCTTCGAYIGVEEEEVELEEGVTEEVVEVEDPVESGETDSEDDGEEASAETPVEEETNPTTGVALGLIPMAIAAVAVAVSKKH